VRRPAIGIAREKNQQARGDVACKYARRESVTALSASCRRISLHLRGTDKGGRVDVYEAVVEGLARRVREIS
jgi:hypothetical protein